MILVFALPMWAKTQTFEWARRFGSSSNDVGYSIGVDANGNVYTLGSFAGTTDFDPGPSVFNLTAASQDVFLSKLDANGNFVWARQFGGNSILGHGLAVDAIGNVVFTGDFGGTTDFDPGVGVFNLSSSQGTGYITKLDAAGNFVWARQLGGGARGVAIAIDVQGNVISTGYFSGSGDFDPGSGNFNMTAIGNQDVYVSKIDVNGDFVWARRLGGSSTTESHSIAADTLGNVYTTGYFLGNIDFDPGIGSFNLVSGGGTDIFVSKLDLNGNFLWARRFGGSGTDTGSSVALDQGGNVHVAGYFMGTADFDPGIGVLNLVSSGGSDVFVAKLDVNGNYIWAKRFGGLLQEYAYGVAVDLLGNVYSIGLFEATADFDPGISTSNLISYGSYDVFISKLDLNGDFLWANHLGGSQWEFGYSIALAPNHSLVATGYFGGSADFDPSVAAYLMTSLGQSDIFVFKQSRCLSSFAFISETTCTSYLSPSGNHLWTNSGTYQDTILNRFGCDSILSINLTINLPTSDTIDHVACDSFNLNGQLYFASGTYTQLLQNTLGCDSALILNLTINSPTDTVLQVSECESFILNNQSYTTSGAYTQHLQNQFGCDSVIQLQLTILEATTSQMTISACDSFLLNSQVYLQGGMYSQSLTNAEGCDSLITLNLTITPTPIAGIVQNNDTLIASPAGAIYQWLHCDSGFTTIGGATTQSFVPTLGGLFAVAVDIGGCRDTSACLNIVGATLNLPHIQKIQCFPNPNNGQFHLDLPNLDQHRYTLKFFDQMGRQVWSAYDNGSRPFLVDIRGMDSGIYHIQAISDSEILTAEFLLN